MTANFIAPGTGDVEVIFFRGITEFRSLQIAAHRVQAPGDGVDIRRHQTDPAAHYLRLAGRQVKLATADIDPHIDHACDQIRVAREAHPDDVKQYRQPLIGHRHVDMLEPDDIR